MDLGLLFAMLGTEITCAHKGQIKKEGEFVAHTNQKKAADGTTNAVYTLILWTKK